MRTQKKKKVKVSHLKALLLTGLRLDYFQTRNQFWSNLVSGALCLVGTFSILAFRTQHINF